MPCRIPFVSSVWNGPISYHHIEGTATQAITAILNRLHIWHIRGAYTLSYCNKILKFAMRYGESLVPFSPTIKQNFWPFIKLLDFILLLTITVQSGFEALPKNCSLALAMQNFRQWQLYDGYPLLCICVVAFIFGGNGISHTHTHIRPDRKNDLLAGQKSGQRSGIEVKREGGIREVGTPIYVFQK